jgi:hypothetical protein
MIMKQGMVLTGGGVAIGLVLCFLASKGVSAAVVGASNRSQSASMTNFRSTRTFIGAS